MVHIEQCVRVYLHGSIIPVVNINAVNIIFCTAFVKGKHNANRRFKVTFIILDYIEYSVMHFKLYDPDRIGTYLTVRPKNVS